MKYHEINTNQKLTSLSVVFYYVLVALKFLKSCDYIKYTVKSFLNLMDSIGDPIKANMSKK